MSILTSFRIMVMTGLTIITAPIHGCDKDDSPTAASSNGAGNSGASSGGSGAASAAAANDQAAAEFVRGKIAEKWVKTADGWTTQLYRRNAFGEPMEGLPEVLYLQYRDMQFSVNAVTLTESQKLNGTTYRAEVTFEYVPARRFHTEKSMMAPPGWSRWDEEQPASTIAVELRNGKWLTEDLEMFAGLKPDSAAVPK